MANLFDVSGVCVGGCSCGSECLCCSPGQPTRESCRFSAAWRIEDGRYGTVSLRGLQLAAACTDSCADPSPSGVLYGDESATPEQRAAIEELFLGGRCQRPAALQAVSQNITAVRWQKVQVQEQAGRMHVSVPGVLSATLELIPVGTPEPAWATGGHAGSRAAGLEIGELGAGKPGGQATDTGAPRGPLQRQAQADGHGPRLYGFHSRFRWVG